MDSQIIMKMFNELAQSRQEEVIDFIRFLKYQQSKEQILKADQEGKISYSNIDELMDAIDNAN